MKRALIASFAVLGVLAAPAVAATSAKAPISSSKPAAKVQKKAAKSAARSEKAAVKTAAKGR